MTTELSPKRLELLKEAVPKISRVMFLHDPEAAPNAWKLTEEIAPRLGVTLQQAKVGAADELLPELAVIGKEHSDLGATLNRVAASHPELHMTPIDDIWPQEGFYFRSDHYNFARKGIPILFFFNGTHPDYHEVSDELAKIDAEKESRIVKLDFYLGLEIAGSPERPKWNPESYKRIVQGAN